MRWLPSLGGREGVGGRCLPILQEEIAAQIAEADWRRRERSDRLFGQQLHGLHPAACFAGQAELTAALEDASVRVEVLAAMEAAVRDLNALTCTVIAMHSSLGCA